VSSGVMRCAWNELCGISDLEAEKGYREPVL
jgi:hypothetical protein